jgi:hypothetical protein
MEFAHHLRIAALLTRQGLKRALVERMVGQPQPGIGQAHPAEILRQAYQPRFAPPRCEDGKRMSVAIASAKFCDNGSPSIS